MSTFQGYAASLVPLGYSILQTQQQFISWLCTSPGQWQCHRQAYPPMNTTGSTIPNPGNAIDGTPTTSAGGAGAAPGYLELTFPAAFTPTALYIQVGLTYATSTTYELDAPSAWTLDYYNGSTWVNVQTWSGQVGWAPGERRRFTVAGAPSTWTIWRVNFTSNNGSANTYIAECVLEDLSSTTNATTVANWGTSYNFADFVPVATELIGNSVAREVLRINFLAASINFAIGQELLTSMAGVFSWDTAAAAAVTLTITGPGGNSYSYTGSAGNTATQNARALFELCAANANSYSDFAAWNWVWFGFNQGVTGCGYFYAVQKTPGMTAPFTSNANIVTRIRMAYAQGVPSIGMMQGCSWTYTQSLTYDLVNGFIAYLQISSRSICLGVKTNVGYNGPIYAGYGANADALAQLPTSDLSVAGGPPCTPIELVIGATDGTAANSGGTYYVGHVWGICSAQSTMANNGILLSTETNGNCPFWSKGIIPGFMQEFGMNSAGLNWSSNSLNAGSLKLGSEGQASGADTASTWASIHRMGAVSFTIGIGTVQNTSWASGRGGTPGLPMLDFYRYVGTPPSSEQMILAPDQDYTAVANGNQTNAATTINITSLQTWPPVSTMGYAIIDGEVVTYTGITNTGAGGTTNSLTGCVRGAYSTSPVNIIGGVTNVVIGGWFIAFNNGLLFFGYTKPV